MSAAVIVVQARMGSTRLPGKVLQRVGDRTVLELMLDRIRATAMPVVVATSDLARDDPIEALIERRPEGLYRGPEEDVLQRVQGAVGALKPEFVVRLTADCPLADAGLVRACVATARVMGADYTSNTLVRTHPDGLDVEVVGARALAAACEEATDDAEREHVTPFVYRRPERFSLAALVDRRQAGHERWTVDTPADLARLDAMIAALPDPAASWTQIHDRFRRRRPRDRVFLTPILANEGAGPPSLPAARRWAVHAPGGAVVGWIGVDVRSGIGTTTGSLPSNVRKDARAALAEALKADAQVIEMSSADDGG